MQIESQVTFIVLVLWRALLMGRAARVSPAAPDGVHFTEATRLMKLIIRLM